MVSCALGSSPHGFAAVSLVCAELFYCIQLDLTPFYWMPTWRGQACGHVVGASCFGFDDFFGFGEGNQTPGGGMCGDGALGIDVVCLLGAHPIDVAIHCLVLFVVLGPFNEGPLAASELRIPCFCLVVVGLFVVVSELEFVCCMSSSQHGGSCSVAVFTFGVLLSAGSTISMLL